MGARVKTFTVEAGVVSLFVMDCSECGVIYGFAAAYEERRRDDGKGWVCPNGHRQAFVKSEVDRQRERADAAERDARWANNRADRLRMERDAEARSARAYKGHMTRLRNRIAAGVCPVQGCRRNFVNVRGHIIGQHPDWAAEHIGALAP